MRGMWSSAVHRRVEQVPLDGLGDVDGEVADALEVGVDLHRGQHGPQIDRDRLVQRQQLDAALVDLDVQVVEWLVARLHARREVGVALHQRGRHQAHLLLGDAAHHEQPLLQRVEVLLHLRHHPRDRLHRRHPTRTVP